MAESAAILIIDDEAVIRESCCRILGPEGYRIETAADGERGLQKVKELKPDLALVDLKMPGVDGIEVLEKIREIDPAIISIVITGYATIETAVEAMKRNAYDFIPKPFTPDQLKIIVKRGLEKRNLAQESARLRYEKNKMRENFITLVSHQLRSPLISIQQYFEVILGGFTGEVSGKQREMIREASERIEELIKLINNWLNMTRIEAKNLTGKFQPVNLSSLISQTVELMCPVAKAKKVILRTDCPDSLALIKGCEESLKQALTNLISNGINYNRAGGTATLKARENGDFVVVEVSDTGIGISPENLPFIFDEFFRAKVKETQGITGSGLGLSIVKRIIEAHQGSISVKSELDKGTTISVLLPKTGLKP
ncbi:MAG: hypothetical protein AMJ79_10015 [Phycisphaerae bacterium SM23_30]|nr:MAG: hypothetical protein AMJ79_10015 [Phycisphaerae bacterium SM23_30]